MIIYKSVVHHETNRLPLPHRLDPCKVADNGFVVRSWKPRTIDVAEDGHSSIRSRQVGAPSRLPVMTPALHIPYLTPRHTSLKSAPA